MGRWPYMGIVYGTEAHTYYLLQEEGIIFENLGVMKKQKATPREYYLLVLGRVICLRFKSVCPSQEKYTYSFYHFFLPYHVKSCTPRTFDHFLESFFYEEHHRYVYNIKIYNIKTH